MKTRLLFMLLFVSSLSFAQNWSQVGATQFTTNFAINGEIAFDNAGVPYVLYESPTNNAVYVMKFNGTNWVDVGNGAISTEDYANLAIKINPVTNQPWVVMRAAANGTASNVDVYSYNGTSWVIEGANVGASFWGYSLQLNFSGSGEPRFVGMISDGGNLRPRFYSKSGSSWSGSSGIVAANARVDYYDYNNGVIAADGSVRSFGFGGIPTVFLNAPALTNYRKVSAGADYFAVNDVTNGTIITGNSNATMTQPTGVSGHTNNILKFRESITDNQQYLMYSDSNENLMFQTYKFNNSWATLPSIGLATNTTDFFVKMEMNPADGNMYVLYKDGARMSVKKFTVAPLLNLSRVYIDTNATGTGDGSSWADAYTSISDVLYVLGSSTTELWIASGTYKPGTDREDSFIFNRDNLEVYGGFDGTETLISERDIAANPTILSGDLNGNDTGVDFTTSTREDNSFHVVKINADGILLDGLTIQDGHASGGTGNNEASAILKLETANTLNLKNCIIKNNVSLLAGAVRAFFNDNGTMNIENCIVEGNVSSFGAGLYVGTRDNRTLNVTIVNSLFSKNISKDNSTSNKGYSGSSAWIRANGSGSSITANIVNSTFANNLDIGTQTGLTNRGTLTLSRGGSGRTFNATISNSIFYNNRDPFGDTSLAVTQGHASSVNFVEVKNSIDEDNFSNLTYLTNTSSSDPLFKNLMNNDFSLLTGSPAIDTGDNSEIPTGITSDLVGNQRIYNTTVDMGAYEFGSIPVLSTENTIVLSEAKVYPNPVRNNLYIKSKENILKIEVYNLLGKKIIEKENSSFINLSNLKASIYFVRVYTQTNRISKRIIKN